VLTVAGLHLGGLFGGAVILEYVFGLPGLGRGFVQAVIARDYPVVQSLAMVLVALVLLVNLVVDIVYALADPRISYA
jgi:ABC-type dipeptide/oligopeptide/nickel transport system permease component